MTSTANLYDTNSKMVNARLARSFVYDFGCNKIDITPTAMKMMFLVSPYVDYEGLIQLSKVEITRLLKVQPNFFVRTLASAKNANIIEERDGELYSLVHTFKESRGYSYVDNYTRLVDGSLPSVGKWAMKLFAYILGASYKGSHTVNIENLYDNKLHIADNGIDYFPDAKRVIDALVRLLHYDLIKVEFPGGNKKGRVVLDSNNIHQHRELLERYVEIETYLDSEQKEIKSKKRTGSNKALNHKLYLSVSSSVTGTTEKVQASQKELQTLLDKNHHCIDLLRKKTVYSLIGSKNKLYAYSGVPGWKLYKKSLSDFLSEEMPLIDYYDLQEYRVHNYFMNYYVLPSIQTILVQVAKDFKKAFNDVVALPSKFLTPYGYMTLQEINGLLEFFNETASRNHIVVIEKLLRDAGLNKFARTESNLSWEKIFTTAADIRNEFLISKIEVGSIEELREFTYDLATKNLINQKEKYILFVNQFNKYKYPQGNPYIPWNTTSALQPEPVDDVPKPIRFYNWLEER